MLGIAYVFDAVQVTQLARLTVGCSGEHRVDCGRDELDVPELLRGNARDQVVERPCALPVPEVERLVGVVHEGRHLAELATQQLLNGSRTGGIGIRWGWHLGLQPIDSQNHGLPP